MAEYEPIKQSSNQSLTTSITESNPESKVLSDDELVDLADDFASFKCFSPGEIETLLVTFYQSKQIYTLDSDVEARFFALNSTYQMQPDDLIGICPMSKKSVFISKRVSECPVELNSENVTEEIILDENDFIAKKANFGKIETLPAELANEFYFQFCYMNSKNEVIGLSTPFRFQRNAALSDSMHGNLASVQMMSGPSHAQLENMAENYDSMMMEKRDDDDFIVVRSQESFLKERVEHLTKSNTLLEYLIRSLEKDLSDKTVELQKLSNKLEDEKANVAQLDSEKKQVLADIEDISRKHAEMQQAMTELKQRIEQERHVNEQLQAQLEFSKKKIFKLEDTYQNTSDNEAELKKILKDKEEEIAISNDMVANFKKINEELGRKLLSAEDRVLNLQSSLATALNERRMLVAEQDKYSNYETLVSENSSLKQRVFDLESIKEKQANEIKTLEDELHNSVANFNNLDTKLQAERNVNVAKEQKTALALDKTKLELIEMHARLEQSRVEYANLYRKYRSLQKGERSKLDKTASSPASRSNSVASLASTSSRVNVISQAKMDDIDLKLQQLDKEEEPQQSSKQSEQVSEIIVQKQTAPPPASLPLGANNPRESLLIDIENEQSNDAVSQTSEVSETQAEANTCAKTLISPVASAPPKEDKTVVAIPCIMCDKVIECRQHEDGSGQMHEMVNHLETVHKQKMCPVCSTLFDTRLPIFSTYFANHIQNHFNNIKYPQLSNNAN